jgi:hypothetical protein
MAVTNQQIIDYLVANPNLSDAQIVAAMEQNGISPAQMASAVGIPEGQIISRVAAVVPPGQSVSLGDTRIAPQYQTIGQGMDQQIGGVEAIYVDKTTGDANYKAPVGSKYQVLSPDGTYQSTGTIKKDQSFFGGLVDAFKDPVVLAALGGAAYGGLFGGAGAAGTGALGAEGLTLGELGLNANNLAAATNVADVVGATEGGLLSSAPTGLSLAELSGTAGVTPAVASAVTPAATTGLLSSIPTGVTDVASKIATGVGTGLLTKSLADTVSGVTQTAGSLLQSQTSKEAAQKAASDITKATQTAQEAAQFRPVGMTTRFGTSNYTYDPVTGRMVSAGYTLSPEAKAAQDRLVGLAGRGLTQAEQAQQQFAPLQTGAQNLFSLGNQYISQSPQDVAQNYLNQQMALLQPSRELELANLQNRLQQQGRAGLSVAQGGTLGATTPELQALYNARAQQEAQLAANAQQAGQQNVLFGAGLLSQGANAMGNYYGGQAAAYQPYTTALGQIQGLETAAQQPLTMGANLAQQASAAGARAGQLGLTGQQLSSAYSTGANATYNPYAGLLTAAGNPNSMFGQVASSAFAPGGVVDRYLYPSGNPLQTGNLADPGLWT